ncbi:Ig-like domain repeat protein [Terriglobus sp.]|uniref:Ig-like domain repeat protein n=1 Tax=Terriglobus sp. TaxID=1889013 RepID=UPI003AFF895F
MQPVADRVPRRVISVACGIAFVMLAVLSAFRLQAQTALPDSQPLSGVGLELKRSDAQQADLLELLQAQRTPGTAEYRRWLTPEQFADRFAPDASTRLKAESWLQQQGLQVTGTARNGMRILFSGSTAQVQRAFGVALQVRVAGDTSELSVQPGFSAVLPQAVTAYRLRLPAGGADAATMLANAIDANTEAAVVVPSTVADTTADTWHDLLEEAAAQGITVLQVNGGGLDGDRASAAVLASAAGAAQANDASTSRPDWQAAPGLPANGQRMVPDALLGDAATLVQALNAFAAQHGRVGALAPQLYRLATGHGVFTHADAAAADGSWTAADGLGAVNVTALLKALATGTTGVNVALAASNTTVTHGTSLSLAYTVTGTGGTPSGTVTATLKGRSGGVVTLGPTALNESGVAAFATSTLPGDVYDVSGTYSGDSTFAAGTSNVVTTTVSPENVALSATAPATAFGGMIPVTITATSSSGVGVPSGAVTVTAFASAIPTTYTGTLPSSSTNTASTVVNVPATTLGKLTLQASCTSNGSFACTQPASLAAVVTTATPTVTLTSTPEVTVANSATQKYDLAVSVVAPSGSTAVAPTGAVAIQNNGVQIAMVTLNKGAGTYTVSLGGASNSLVAAYAGDTNYDAASSAAVVVSAPLISTTTTLAASPSSLNFGSLSSLTASVTPGSYAAGAPTGTITYRSNLQGVIGTATLGNGFVTYAAALQVGTHSITATYSGDANYATSVSSAGTVAVALGKVSTTTVLSLTPALPLAGQNTMLTATVTPNFPAAFLAIAPSVTCTGQVTLLSNGAFVANGTLSGGTVTVAGKLVPGSDSLTAVYGGDTQCYGSTSGALVVAPARVATAITVQPSAGYANAGQTIQLTATLTGADAGILGVPTGTVTFYDTRGGVQVTVGTAVLSASGPNTALAAINVYGSSAGPHSFSAVYSGDGIFLAATSATAVVNFGDFSIVFNPASLSIRNGGSGSAIASMTVLNGFSAPVVLTCVPPGGSQIQCTFQSPTLTAGSSAGLTVTATAQSGKIVRASRTPLLTEAGATLAALLLMPFARTRRFGAVLLLACCVTLAASGCGLGTVDSTNNLNGSGSTTGAGSGGTTTGTPLGTQLLTITAASGDGTLRHTYTYPVTVQ